MGKPVRQTPSNKLMSSGGELQLNLGTELCWSLELPKMRENDKKTPNRSSRSQNLTPESEFYPRPTLNIGVLDTRLSSLWVAYN